MLLRKPGRRRREEGGADRQGGTNLIWFWFTTALFLRRSCLQPNWTDLCGVLSRDCAKANVAIRKIGRPDMLLSREELEGS